uniref:Uncharacterized protein n=1 Tax=viral metagenome TaxID=1070528 RepID=A0A6C0CZL4_9ZZZZ
MDYDKLNIKALDLFKSFIKDIINVYPEHKSILYDKYGDIIVGDSNDITNFLENISKYEKLITNRDNKLFNKENIIFEGIPMSELWKEDISDSTKKNIWKYLQTFCVIHINLKSSESLKELLSGESNNLSSTDKKDLKDLKKIKKMKDDINKSDSLFGDLNIEEMLGNSTIGKIAKEITESIDLPNLESPEDLSKLFQGESIMNIFNTVNTTVKNKIDSGELSNDILKKEAEGMYPNMMKNDLFKSMSETMSKFKPEESASGINSDGININNNNLA